MDECIASTEARRKSSIQQNRVRLSEKVIPFSRRRCVAENARKGPHGMRCRGNARNLAPPTRDHSVREGPKGVSASVLGGPAAKRINLRPRLQGIEDASDYGPRTSR